MQDVINEDKNESFNAKVGGTSRSIKVGPNSDITVLGSRMRAAGIPSGSMVDYKGTLYYYTESGQYDGDETLVSPKARAFKVISDNVDEILKQSGWTQYKTGGLADFTGPAWLDGTKSHPELVLNSRDTQNFI
jgi:hypothetical protein